MVHVLCRIEEKSSCSNRTGKVDLMIPYQLAKSVRLCLIKYHRQNFKDNFLLKQKARTLKEKHKFYQIKLKENDKK